LYPKQWGGDKYFDQGTEFSVIKLKFG